MTVCGALRSKDSVARDGAREVLGKIVKDLGPERVRQILEEITATCREGKEESFMLMVMLMNLTFALCWCFSVFFVVLKSIGLNHGKWDVYTRVPDTCKDAHYP